ncbi:prolyl oligopeptidase family serine peptidase [Rohdeia mirabilis]
MRTHRTPQVAAPAHAARSPLALGAQILGALALLAACGSTDGARQRAEYPATRTQDLTEVFHGTEVVDPYRWLEGDVRTDPEVAAWVRAQDQVARRSLARIDERDAIAERLEELWDYPKVNAPARHGEHWYSWVNSGLEAQSRLVRASLPEFLLDWEANLEMTDFTDSDGRDEIGFDVSPDEPTLVELVLDPNLLSEDGTVAYSGGAFSHDGRYLAYGTSASGSDWKDWQVLDLETLAPTGDVLTGIKWGGVSWMPDDSGFFYARYDVPEEDKFTARVTDQRVWFHRVGTPQSDDLLIHERPDQPEWSFSPRVSDDGRWLVLHIWMAGNDNQVHVFDLENASATPLALVDQFTADYSYVGTAPTGELLLRTDQDAPNGRVLAVDPRTEPPTWMEVVPEREWRLEGIDEVGGRLVAEYLADASSRVVLYDFVTSQEEVETSDEVADAPNASEDAATAAATDADRSAVAASADATSEGAAIGGDATDSAPTTALGPLVLEACVEGPTVELPGIGSVGGLTGDTDATEVFFAFSSFATPGQIHRLDLATGTTELAHQDGPKGLDPSDYTVTQVWYESKDGTRVPMFLCHRAGLEPATDGPGEHPTLLYGYGGFDVSLTPGFSVSRLVWMEMGGVFAMPNLRGGGEFGEAWHSAGTRTRKQNVFDDFIAAGEWLVANGWTRPDRLAIQGGSNGGLLVGACLIQRPDLFGACLPAVGVMDMLRFHLFTAGRYWVDDYGSVDVPEEFQALLAYSPYHNLEDGAQYPATLITTADTDDRVVPGHSFKFAARMQAAQGGPAPVLLRVESSAGHGAGKPTAKRIAEAADLWAFLVRELDFEPRL